MPIWHKMLWLAVAGACGSIARYSLAGFVQNYSRSAFPWGTLIVNVAGCFAFGLVWALSQDRMAISPEIRTIVIVGFLGSFTTFSAFLFETEQMLEHAEWFFAVLNVLGELTTGFAAYFLGTWIGRAM